MNLHRALTKLGEFVSGGPSSEPRLIPFPWADARSAPPPYYTPNPVSNVDGRGGYAQRYAFDSDGIPYQALPDGGRRYSALVTARYALKQLAIGADPVDPTGSAQAHGRALQVLPALVASARDGVAWGNGPTADAMSSTIPSAMVQGVVVSALLRIVDGRPDAELSDVLDRAFACVWRPIAEGGTRSTLDGGPFLEEFPRQPPAHILNGCVYALFGLYDLADATGHAAADHAAQAIERTLGRTIARFDGPLGWSRYALDVYGHRPLASVHYHAAHVALVRIVGQRSGQESLAAAAQRWERALRTPAVRLLLAPVKAAQVIAMRGFRRLPLNEG